MGDMKCAVATNMRIDEHSYLYSVRALATHFLSRVRVFVCVCIGLYVFYHFYRFEICIYVISIEKHLRLVHTAIGIESGMRMCATARLCCIIAETWCSSQYKMWRMATDDTFIRPWTQKTNRQSIDLFPSN